MTPLPRRQMLRRAAGSVAWVASAGVGAGLLGGCSAAPVKGFPSTLFAQRAVANLNDSWRSAGAFSLPQMLSHLAQSIEYSMRGFAQAKSAFFQHTVGAAAFAVFQARGAMTHGLDEPIPGAPDLAAEASAQSLDAAKARLLAALREFDAYAGALAPHFAYGALGKAEYARAHLMHMANHWTELIAAA
jgi:hypothetical protein